MYDTLFINNFLLNFFSSFLFIIFNIYFSFIVDSNLLKKDIKLFTKYQPIIIFFFIFGFIALLFNILIGLNKYQYFTEILTFIIILQILYVVKEFNFIELFNFKNFKFSKIDFFIIVITVSLFLISILPITDADSISVHQNLSNEIYLNGLKNLDIEKNLGFTIYSNTQNLLIISPLLKSDNFGAQLNIIILIFFCIYKYKSNKNFILILLSCPLIIYFVSTQKLQLFFGILYLIIFIIINEKLIKSRVGLFLTIFLLFFYSSGNVSYILFTIPLYIYLLFNYKNNFSDLIIYSVLAFTLTILPIFIIKHIYFNNFLAPFFDSYIGSNNLIYNSLAYSLRATEGWLQNPSNLQIYLRPFISLKIFEFSSSLGIIFLFMLINIKLQKKLKFFPLVIIIIVLSTGQILPRYYLEAFLILSFYFNLNNIYLKFLTFSQNIGILIISIIFLKFAYFNMNVFFDKTNYMNKFSFSYFNSQQQKKLNIDENILDLTSVRPSLFYDKNIYSKRSLLLLKDKPEYDEYFKNFIKEKSIKYIISDNSEYLPECLKINKIKKINQIKAIRNFLIKPLNYESYLYEIKKDYCNN